MSHTRRIVIALLWLTFTLEAASMPAEADFVVAPDGSGDFTAIQAAINAVPSNSDRATIIFIRRGVYNTEKLIIPADKKNVTIIGESREETIISYHTYHCTEGICPTADAAKWSGDNIRTAATLTILGSGFRAENLTIRNTAGPVGQAQALTIRADKTVFINCDIAGYQDTIYFWNPGIRSYFGHCLIAGRTDYIYGDGIAFFDQCEIRSWGGGWITAPSTPQSQPYGFVFSHCTVTYALGSPRAGDDGEAFYLGRPWHAYPKVAWLFCNLSEKIDPRGWDKVMSEEEMGPYIATSTDIHLFEYGNTGPGAGMSGRVAWAGLRALTSEEALNFTVQKVMAGSDNWDPSANHPQFFEGTGILTVGNEGPQPIKLPAFPGAEGHGKYVTGGRGGQVIYVTNLNDDANPGSLRYAINQSGTRLILFKVSGTIQLKSALRITKGDVTIAGQTAPGDGITLRDYPVNVDADNVIIRYLRFRMGDAAQQEGDAIGGREISRVIIDHCSMSWSTDECVSFYQNEDFTLQWCLISESLRNSVHGKGAHGYGGIWGGRKASFHHNLLAHHDSRNPRLGEINGSPFALTDLVDLRNNVIYNWVGNSCYGGEGMNANIVNCYYKPGPGTTKKERIISIDKETETGFPTTGIWGKFFIDGNFMAGSTRATADNWTYGVYAQFNSGYGSVPAADKTAMRLTTPLDPGEITTHPAEKAYERVLEYAGASLVRDTVDRRIIRDVSTGTATFMTGGNGSVNGIMDTQNHVGGWPGLATLPAPADSDSDGMPDGWEDANGLDKNSPADARLTTVDGKYPNIEVYINSLVAGITENQIKEGTTTAARMTGKRHDPLRLSLDYGAGLLRINHETRITRLELCSITGAMLATRDIRDPQFVMNINHLRPGIYIVRIRDVNQEIHSGKFIKY